MGRRSGLLLLGCGLWLAPAVAQVVPATPSAPVASPTQTPVQDTLKAVAPAAVDTVRRPSVVAIEPEAADPVTRRLAVRISGAIVVLTLTTLLLYNVRSR